MNIGSYRNPFPSPRTNMNEFTPADMASLDDLRRQREEERKKAEEERARKEASEAAIRESMEQFRETVDKTRNPDPDRPEITEHPDRVEIGQVEVPRKKGSRRS